MNRYKDWLEQAKRDLDRCELDIKYEFFDWACFTAQQAAEKSIKSLIYWLGGEPWGHSITQFFNRISDNVAIPNEIIEYAQLLDTYYIATRYPNAWPAGIPKEYFNKNKAEEAYNGAKKIYEFCKDKIYRQK